MTTCAYGGCNKPVPQHILDRGGRFCSTPCRAADHREKGKSVPATVQSVSRCKDGASVVVVRVPSEFYSKLEPYTPGYALTLTAGN